MSALERVASQVDGGALFIDNFVRTLEALGHIDVRRDSTLLPAEWEANPAFLGETVGNGFMLAGVWSVQSRSSLGHHVAGAGGQLVQEVDESGLSVWFVRGLSCGALEVVVDRADLSAEVVPMAAERMLEALPPLSEVEASMPRVPIPDYSKATYFEVSTAKWRSVPGVALPGAYRVEQSFRTVSIFVDPHGALDRTCRVGTVQLVKHLAAKQEQRSLLGFHPRRDMLLAPMGAELPGLYGRAVLLCSGHSPSVSPRIRTIGYHGVPRHLADAMHTLLTS
jgi:hypothetical protein